MTPRSAAPAPVVPTAIMAEAALLGSVLRLAVSGRKEDARAAIAKVVPRDFYRQGHREIASAILAIDEEGAGIDPLTLAARLRAEGREVDEPYLYTILESVPVPDHVEDYARLVRETAIRRDAAAKAARFESAVTAGSMNGEAVALRAVLDRLEAGIEPEDLGLVTGPEHVNVKPAEAILDGLLYRRILTLFSGPPRMGKSMAALALAVHLAARNDFGIFPVARPFRVLYFSGEDGKELVAPRIVDLSRGLGLSVPPETLNIFYRTLAINALEGERGIRRRIERHKADVVIFDVLLCYHTADENSNSAMRPVMDRFITLAREMNVAILLLHHLRKGGLGGDDGDAIDRSRGASCIAGSCPVILTGPRSRLKVRTKLAEVPDFALALERGDDYQRIHAIDPDQTHDARRHQGDVREMVKKMSLEAGGQDVGRSELKKQLKVSLNTLRTYVRPLLDAGELEEIRGKKNKVFFRLGIPGRNPVNQPDLIGSDNQTT